MFKEKNVVNNVDRSSVRAPSQNGRYKYKLKRSLKKEYCKQCRLVKFKETMTKWPVHKQTHRTTQNT